MTAEELAQLGYRPSMGSADLNAASSSVSPQDLQQFYATAGNAAAPEMPIAGAHPQFDPAMLNQLMGSQPPQSDPDNIVPSLFQVADSPSGGTLILPPNTGAANTYGGTAAPESQQPLNQTQQPETVQTQPESINKNVATALGFPQFSDWAKASGLPRQVMPDERKVILEKYLDQQNDFLARQDPEKQLKLQQMQHEISTQGMKDQNLQAQTAESQSKVIAGELAKQNAMDAANGQISELQSQRDNLQAIANHPALNSMVGLAGQYNPGVSDKQRELKSYFDMIDGQKLIDGINKIKNESAVPGSPLNFRITQQEAMAVKDSVNRLKRSQSPDDYRNAVSQYSSILDRAIAAKQAQVARMPGVNQELLKQFSYTPASAAGTQAQGSPAAPASAPTIKTIPGRGTFQSLGNGQWKQIQ